MDVEETELYLISIDFLQWTLLDFLYWYSGVLSNEICPFSIVPLFVSWKRPIRSRSFVCNALKISQKMIGPANPRTCPDWSRSRGDYMPAADVHPESLNNGLGWDNDLYKNHQLPDDSKESQDSARAADHV